MEKKWINVLLLVVILFIIVFLGFFIIKKPTITGIVVYEESINTLNWTFDDINDFSYDSSLINLSDGQGKLSRSVVENTWSVDNITEMLVISALEYEPGKIIHDRTIKVQSLDADGANINKDKEIFDVTFDRELANNDIVSMYVLESDNINVDINIFLCDNGTICNESGYGLVNFNGGEGWYNITISGLDGPKNIFNIDSPKNMKFDYIKAVHKDTTTYTSTNISYPESALIETKDISITSSSSFLNFHKNDLLNGQNIDYSYSVDSGNSWDIIPANNNLSDVSVSSGKIRIKANLSGNGTETPVVYDFAVSYSTQICNENWNLTYGVCLSNNTKLKYYVDKNECSTADNLPSDNDTYESCVYDGNVENETSNTQNTTKFLIDKKQESDVLLELTSKSNILTDSVSIVEYSTNLKNSTPDSNELGKYIDITADSVTKQNLTSINIKIYYTDEEVANAGLDEDTLKIHYFNETNNQWQILNSTVNVSGNYVEVTIEHLSTFGIFGDKEVTPAQESSGSSSSGGGGGSRRIPQKIIMPKKEVKTETPPVEEEKPEEIKEQVCDYKISVSIPEHISFVEYDNIKGIVNNIGGCEIENLNIDISPELKDIIRIENKEIGNVNINESIEFLLLKKLETNRADLLIQGFNIKIPKENIKTYSGSLTFGAIVQEQVAFEEKINVKVDLLESPLIIGLVSSNISVVLFAFLLFIVTFFVLYPKFYQNKGEKLTKKQIEEIEEKVEKTKKKYSDRKKY